MVIKNPTPRQIGFLTSVFATVLITVVIALFIQFSTPKIGWVELAIMVPIILVVVYLVVMVFIKEYIYRKIKLIYTW